MLMKCEKCGNTFTSISAFEARKVKAPSGLRTIVELGEYEPMKHVKAFFLGTSGIWSANSGRRLVDTSRLY